MALAGASSEPLPLRVANYATETARHERPTRSVSAQDVVNAANTLLVDNGENTYNSDSSGWTLIANLGELQGHPRVIAFVSQSTYKYVCVDLPAGTSSSPALVSCPGAAIALMDYVSLVMNVARSAVAEASAQGKAVSGNDVVKATSGSGLTLSTRPLFKSGQGGTVGFVVKLGSPATTSRGTICVRFPTTAYGIPIKVSCLD